MQKKRSPPAPEGKGASVKGPTSGPVSTLGLHRSTAEVRPPSLARDLPLTPRSIRRPQLLVGPSLPKAAPAAKEQAGHPTPCQVPDSAKAPTPEGKLVIRLPHRAVEHPQSLDRRCRSLSPRPGTLASHSWSPVRRLRSPMRRSPTTRPGTLESRHLSPYRQSQQASYQRFATTQVTLCQMVSQLLLSSSSPEQSPPDDVKEHQALLRKAATNLNLN